MSDPHDAIRWFGASWGARICDPAHHIPTPAGRVCGRCDGEIDPDDQGVTIPAPTAVAGVMTRLAWHLDCWLTDFARGAARARLRGEN